MTEESPFTIRDRRRTQDDSAPPPAPPAAQDTRREAPAHHDASPAPHPDMPPGGFADLVLGLATSAFIALGVQPGEPHDPSLRTAAVSPAELAQARHLIDLLGVLQQKTTGNLTPEESALLQQVLYSLRLTFVEKSRPAPPDSPGKPASER